MASRTNERQLAYKSLKIQYKRFYLDVEESARGRIIKITELIVNGRNRIVFSIPTAKLFKEHLTTFNEHYVSLGPLNVDSASTEERRLMSVVIDDDDRRYFLDLKENSRGRFLRVLESPMFRVPKGKRLTVAIPAQGMIEFRDALTDLLEEYGAQDEVVATDNHLPPKRVRWDNKKYVFHVKQNAKGIYMRITQLNQHYDNCLIIPDKNWKQFRDVIDEYIQKLEEKGGVDGLSSNDSKDAIDSTNLSN